MVTSPLQLRGSGAERQRLGLQSPAYSWLIKAKSLTIAHGTTHLWTTASGRPGQPSPAPVTVLLPAQHPRNARSPARPGRPSYTADLKQELLLNASKCFNHAVLSALYCLLKILFQHQHNFTSHVLSSGLLTQEEPQGPDTLCSTVGTTPLASDPIK